MSFKFNEPRCHRIPKAKFRVTNCAGYGRGLLRRSDIRLWLSDEAIAEWRFAASVKQSHAHLSFEKCGGAVDRVVAKSHHASYCAP